jgi:hypothetical protein
LAQLEAKKEKKKAKKEAKNKGEEQKADPSFRKMREAEQLLKSSNNNTKQNL